MAKYRYISTGDVEEAFRWTGGEDQTEDPEWICDAIRSGLVRFEDSGPKLVIDYPGDDRRVAYQGDWIVFRDGRLHVCTEHVFEVLYSKVEV